MARTDPVYKKLTKKHRILLKKLKNQYHAEEAEAINSLAIARNIEQTFRRMKTEALQDVKTTGCDQNKLREKFKKHYTCDTTKKPPDSLYKNPPEFMKNLLAVTQEHNIKTCPPDSAEIKHVLSKFKNGKAANDIPPELIKYARESDEFLKLMTEILVDLWTNFSMPKSWGLARLATLFKNKGSKKDPDMYRGLSISSSLCKLAVCIILQRQSSWYEGQLSEPQQGFRNNRGTQDAIFTVKSLQQISYKTKSKIYAAFIDLTAAFDTIQRPWLFKMLRNRLNDPELRNANINVLEALYKQTFAHLADDDEALAFEVLAGVRQGGPESPSLFNLLMDWVMRIFEQRCTEAGLKGVTLKFNIPTEATTRAERKAHPNRSRPGSELNLTWVGFADDVGIFYRTESELISGIKILVSIFEEFDLHLSEKKTETMIFNDDRDDEEYPKTLLTINGHPLKNVKTFVYLGSRLKNNEPFTGDFEVTSRINLAKSKFESMRHILANQQLHMWIRLIFYNAFIRSRMTYACQTWTLTAEQIRKLNSADADLKRRMIRGGFKRIGGDVTDENSNPQRYIYSNLDIYKFCKTRNGETSQQLSTYINKQRQKFAAHTIRQPNNRHTKQLLFNDDDNKRPGNQQGCLLKQATATRDVSRSQFIRDARNRKF